MPPDSLISARQVGHARDVRQNLIPAGPQQESGVRPRRLQQRIHRRRERPMVALAMQIRPSSASASTICREPRRLRRLVGNGCSRPCPCRYSSRASSANREQRALQRREDAQLIVGPLDRRQSRAQRLHFFPPMKRFRPGQQMRHAARLQRPRALARQIDLPSLRLRGTARRCRVRRYPHAHSSFTSQATNAAIASGKDCA